MTTELTNCTQCNKECPLNALRCRKGKEYLEQLHTEGKALDIVNSEATEDDYSHVHDGDFSQRHGGYGESQHGGGHRHGRHSCELHGRDVHGRDVHHSKGHGKAWTVDEPEDLDGLLRACGHFLYHKAAGEKSGQGKIMHILSSRKEISQKELQEHLGIQPGSISEILSKMENKGLLQRIKDGEDRRKTIVRITDAGERHVEEFRKNGKGNKNRDIFSALDDRQKEELKKLLGILLESWK